ncbi:DUF2809 domain-containing protein [Actinoplanes sp. NPDC051411]|uniref:ribosomal maturation YjgA family protein n=1 Tax=Actinoplanes sp. NPDC051411 TaxID=3155522 RepID=UPI00344856EB
MTGHLLRVRLIAVAAIAAFLALAFGIRLAFTGGNVLNSSPGLAQYSGTALYAATVYAAVFALFPRTRPGPAAAAAIAFCWLIEFFQMTGIPAHLSDQSALARLALGRTFDPTDLLWYALGVLPLALLHHLVTRHRPAGPPRVSG